MESYCDISLAFIACAIGDYRSTTLKKLNEYSSANLKITVVLPFQSLPTLFLPPLRIKANLLLARFEYDIALKKIFFRINILSTVFESMKEHFSVSVIGFAPQNVAYDDTSTAVAFF